MFREHHKLVTSSSVAEFDRRSSFTLASDRILDFTMGRTLDSTFDHILDSTVDRTLDSTVDHSLDCTTVDRSLDRIAIDHSLDCIAAGRKLAVSRRASGLELRGKHCRKNFGLCLRGRFIELFLTLRGNSLGHTQVVSPPFHPKPLPILQSS